MPKPIRTRVRMGNASKEFRDRQRQPSNSPNPDNVKENNDIAFTATLFLDITATIKGGEW
jgi:hypothetical protein